MSALKYVEIYESKPVCYLLTSFPLTWARSKAYRHEPIIRINFAELGFPIPTFQVGKAQGTTVQSQNKKINANVGDMLIHP